MKRYVLPLAPILVIVCCLTASAADDRPNIIYIMSDDHASHALSCYGSVINQTPNLDRLANEGMRFTNSFCTNSICGPCRAVVLTGKYSHLNGFVRNGNTFNGQQQTVAKRLQAAGYQTAVVGKWHLKSEPTGFDFWHVLIGQGPYYNPPMKTPAGVVKHTGYTTDVITDAALDFLGLTHLREELAGNLSGGQKKLLELGRGMMTDSKLVLLDEPGAGVNPTLMNKIIEMIRRLNAERGYTFCIVEHDMELIARLCDPVIVLVEGKVLTEGPFSEVGNDPRVIDAYFGGAVSAAGPA